MGLLVEMPLPRRIICLEPGTCSERAAHYFLSKRSSTNNPPELLHVDSFEEGIRILSQGNKPGDLVFSEIEIECLGEIGKKYEGKTSLSKNPHEKGSLAWAAWIIGRMGGWKGYRKAGPAGPITMKRGLQKFSILFEGWLLREASEIP